MKQGMDNFYTVFEELLKQKYQDATVMKVSGAFLIRDEDAEAMVREADAFVYGCRRRCYGRYGRLAIPPVEVITFHFSL